MEEQQILLLHTINKMIVTKQEMAGMRQEMISISFKKEELKAELRL